MSDDYRIDRLIDRVEAIEERLAQGWRPVTVYELPAEPEGRQVSWLVLAVFAAVALWAWWPTGRNEP